MIGTVLSFLVTGYQRRLCTQDPGRYILQMHRMLEDELHNWVCRFGRKCYFVARRPALPYYLLLFTVLKMLPLVLFIGAVGSNLIWIISLYVNRSYARRFQVQNDP
ncbi:MAG: hypothetical protein HY652_15940 [Acidobacteria bacterium]|nr:hypothetical protein [Acidobacteriota bacterium]